MDENNFQYNYNPSMNDNMAFNQPQGFEQGPTVDPNHGFQPQPQPKKKKGTLVALIIILIVMIALIGGAAAYYFMVVKSPKAAINSFLDSIDSKLGEATDLIEGNSELASFKFTVNVDPADSINTTNKQYVSLLNNSDLQILVGVDKVKKEASINLSVNCNNDPVAFSVYFDSQTKGVYVYSKEILGKTIKIAEMTDETIESFIDSLSNTTDTKNFVKAAQIIVKTFKNNIKDSMISSSDATYTANGKEVKATKNTIHLDEDSLSELTYNICNELYKNDEFINLFKSNMQTSVKEYLKIIIEQYEKNKDNTSKNIFLTNFDISVYTEGFIPKVTRYEIYRNYETTYRNKEEDASMLQSYIDYYGEDSEVTKAMRSVFEEKDLSSTTAVNIIDDNNYELISITDGIEQKYSIKINSDKNNKNKADVAVSTDVPDFGKVSVNMEYNKEINGEIPTLPTSTAVSFNQLTTADYQKIVTDLSSHEATKPFASIVYLIMYSYYYYSQQATSTSGYSNLNGYYPTTTTNTTTNTTSTVPAGKQKVGSKEYGYVLIPSNWTRFVDPDAPSTLQYSYANIYILTMAYIPTSSMSAYQYASSYASRMKSEGVDVKTATVKVGNYTAYQVYGRYESENTWLVAWIFETEDGQTRSLAIEGPDASNEAFNIPDTFSLE